MNTTRHWLTITSSEGLRLVLGLVSSVLIARTLGPEAFSVYAVLGALAFAAGVTADFGTTVAATQRMARVWPSAEARQRGRAFFWLRLLLVTAFIAVGALLVDPLTRLVFGDNRYTGLVLLTLLGVGASALSGAVSAMLQSADRFNAMSIMILVNAVLTTLLAVALVLLDQLTLVTALVVLGIFTSLITFAVGWGLLPRPLSLRPPPWAALRAEAVPLLRTGVWLWGANVLAALALRLDLFFANRLLDAALVGAYALALNLAMKADVVNRGQYMVLIPAASRLRDGVAVRGYIRRELRRAGVIALLLVPAAAIAGPLITWIYGEAFVGAVPLFRLLVLVVAFEVLTLPLLLLVYAYDRPDLLTVASGLQVAVMLVAAPLLIVGLGAVGAVAARLLSRVLSTAYVLLRMRRLALPLRDEVL